MKQYSDTSKLFEDLSGAAVLVQFFTLYLLALIFLVGANDIQWLHADPILKILPKDITLWIIPILSLILLLFWCNVQWPTKAIISKSLKHSIYGIVAAIALMLALRIISGPYMPEFIPPEESVKPGYLLGMSAGLSEELIFRLGLTPLIYIYFLKWMRVHYAGILSILVVSLLFALLHEVGNTEQVFSMHYFMARFIVPGCVMGLAFYYISSTFIVMMHSTHIL